MSDVNITNNIPFFRDALDEAKARALEIIGGKAERYAKGKITEVGAVDTGALRNSITHAVEGDTAIVGSAIHYAPYVELGTGKHYTPPPEWIENNAARGSGIIANSVKPRPYLRPAVADHVDEYKRIFISELNK